jgi:hypothetical protein
LADYIAGFGILRIGSKKEKGGLAVAFSLGEDTMTREQCAARLNSVCHPSVFASTFQLPASSFQLKEPRPN